jgi:hypothetical protein
MFFETTGVTAMMAGCNIACKEFPFFSSSVSPAVTIIVIVRPCGETAAKRKQKDYKARTVGKRNEKNVTRGTPQVQVHLNPASEVA